MNETRPYLSVIFPIVGAADYLPLSLIDADRRLKESGRDYEIIVVGCGLSESPPEVIKKLAPVIGLRLYDIDPGSRWIDAIRKGLSVAKGRFRLLCDSDSEIEIAELVKLPEFLEKNPESGIVLGKRNLLPDPRRLFHFGVHKLLIPELSDPTSPFICLTAESVEILIGREASGNSAIHFIFSAKKIGIKMSEVPVSFTGSSSKAGSLEVVVEILKNIKIKSGNLFERLLGVIGKLLDKVSKKSPSWRSTEGEKIN